jgi:hypothetical protein
MLDHLAELRSDFSVFHRIDNPDRLSSSRFFSLAELLPLYDGACRAVLLHEYSTNAAPTREEGNQAEAVRVDDPRQLETMTNRDGMLGIEYKS